MAIEFSKVHIWLGTTDKTDEEYLKYFELDYSTEGDFDDPNYKVCGFCKDICEVWYDEDFLEIHPALKDEISILEILKDLELPENELEKALEKCKELKIEKANKVFYYFNPAITLSLPYKDNYNDLKYIGKFETDM